MGAIIWLASFPKSGNTWLRAFLHNLLRNPQEGYDINKLDDFTLGESAYGWYRMFDDRPLEAYTVAEVAALRPKVHHAEEDARNHAVAVDRHRDRAPEDRIVEP